MSEDLMEGGMDWDGLGWTGTRCSSAQAWALTAARLAATPSPSHIHLRPPSTDAFFSFQSQYPAHSRLECTTSTVPCLTFITRLFPLHYDTAGKGPIDSILPPTPIRTAQSPHKLPQRLYNCVHWKVLYIATWTVSRLLTVIQQVQLDVAADPKKIAWEPTKWYSQTCRAGTS
ncbi:hypothetical protein AYO22_00635 [Fonsecaea multimorphosa]|nr:hypothetical protein AYO22_00635 [Fonsecaea multimorphosa]